MPCYMMVTQNLSKQVSISCPYMHTRLSTHIALSQSWKALKTGRGFDLRCGENQPLSHPIFFPETKAQGQKLV